MTGDGAPHSWCNAVHQQQSGRIVAGWEILRGFEPPLSQLLFAMSKLNDTLLQSMQITFATLYDVDPL